MGMRRTLVATAVAGALCVGAAAASSGPQVAITSPQAGESVSRSASPQLAVAGTVAWEVPEQRTTRVFLRRQQCQSGNDDARLSLQQPGNNEVNGCTFLAQPLNEVLIATGDEGLATDYASEDEVKLTLDATRPITGNVRMTGLATAGVGQGVLEVTLTGTSMDGTVRTIGAVSREYVVAVNPVDVGWQVTPPPDLDKVDLAGLTLTLRVRGVNVAHGGVDHRQGRSWLDVPSWSAGFSRRVEFTVDNPLFLPFFAETRPRTATVAEDGTWSGSLPMPADGERTVYARATQGVRTTQAEPVRITVTP